MGADLSEVVEIWAIDFSSTFLQAKRAGSKLKSRIVAEQSIVKWSQTIEQMEDQVSSILQEEK